eukprot:TRINITY_DN405_c0_g1_i1.p1 TRINITY_DN405_c0_g1~~TRINITY_DN405_c0_g1_i1.p1  ORF type:complete len:660 (+),score=294.04 TRINITY_DN405_c0_g1_i1:115-1980(+)
MGGDVQAFVDEMNTEYNKLHKEFEDNFWSTKMALKGHSGDELTRTKNAYERFLGDKTRLAQIREHLKSGDATEEQKRVLAIMEKTYLCYVTESDEAARIKEETVGMESALELARNGMELGYTDPKTGDFKKSSAGMLGMTMRTNDDEAVRKACYEGMRKIGPFVVEDLCAIAKKRNQAARLSGYGDYYEYKIQTTESMTKAQLFEVLDDLEQKTRATNEKARQTLAQRKGEQALLPYNMGYSMAGDIVKEIDPYYPFTKAVDTWARTFAALGIQYEQSTMNLDLCARDKKYDNGFCHWPQCPYVKPNGEFQPCVTNFTSLAAPHQVGSGYRELGTLLHEGGHAAAFANIRQPSPFFAQERAPMSVAYAENQSMFLDTLEGDAAWLSRYAKSVDGKVIPWELLEKKMRQTHDYQVFACRSMLVVPFFEKALYELPEDQMTPEVVLKIADEVETKILGGLSARPVLSIPHILADESSCYYQGYILADMSVYQTRAHFFEKYGSIVDNEAIGKDLRDIYWRPGNSEQFLDLVKKMTGKPLVADAMVAEYDQDIEERIVKEKKEYEAGVQAGPKYSEKDDVLKQLNMRIRMVHGDELVADTQSDTFPELLAKYSTWLNATFPKEE